MSGVQVCNDALANRPNPVLVHEVPDRLHMLFKCRDDSGVILWFGLNAQNEPQSGMVARSRWEGKNGLD